MSGGRLEWRINVPDGTTKVIELERGVVARIRHEFRGLIIGFFTKIWRVLVESWKIGVAEPKKFVHCLRVGLALCVVSLFYYMRPLYEGIGGNAMWAVMTVVVVFEYTVGATICKSINRAVATGVAGSLGVGIHWIASQCGQKYEPIVLGASVFIFGYRVDKLVDMAHERVTTIAIGTSLCILTSMLIWPAWAGTQLHLQTISNLEKLGISLEGYVAEYFSSLETADVSEDDLTKRLLGYKCVLNSKAAEEIMVNFARWEPAHGRFYFRYPWQQYLKIGGAMRSCAYCIDNLNACIDSDMQAPGFLKQHIKDYCMKLSICSSKVLKELAIVIKSSRRSSSIDFSVDEMNTEVEHLQNALKSLPYCTVIENEGKLECPDNASFLEVLSLGTIVTLLIEVVGRIEEIVDAVDKLATVAEFKTQNEKKSQQKQTSEAADTNRQNQEEKPLDV
ncbi:hypothetical protein RND81_06G037700 [Saponaria officinalis]|uniref:Aluminum-activated malate transporter 10 n=1 Tax=Saponaria officinalis TaxID=3572 RepID=A0AAW1K699_SAPOF